MKQEKDDSKVTDGNSDLDANAIVHLDTLYMYMQVHVVDLDGNKYTYDVEPSDMLGVIRQNAATDAGMDVQDVNLKDANDVVLEQDFTDLDGHNVAHDDTLYMFFRIHVIDLDDVKHTYFISNPSASINSIKVMVADDTGLAVKHIHMSQKRRKDHERCIHAQGERNCRR